MRFARWLMLLLVAMGFLVANAQAATRVRVLETWPAGDDVVLARNQNFYVRLAYTADQPIHIWARPYFRGEPAHAGSNPSREYRGTGETFGWFFLMRPDAQVDEIRITAGDGSPARTPPVAGLRIRVRAGDVPWDGNGEPAWVVSMKAAEAVAQRKDHEARINAPVKPGDMALFGGFMLLVCATGLASIGLPTWGLWKWKGAWRVAAALPAVAMAFVVLRIVADTSRDPTSHNLWPFEILIWGIPCALAMAGMVVVRRIGKGRG